MSKRADGVLQTIRNLEYEAYRNNKRIDYYRNRCLSNIERLHQIGRDKGEKNWYIEQAFMVFNKLQDMKPKSESQDYAFREIPLSNLSNKDAGDYEATGKSSNARSGGLGYAHISWGKSALTAMQDTKHDPLRHYWNPHKPYFKSLSPKERSRLDSATLEDSGYWATKNESNK